MDYYPTNDQAEKASTGDAYDMPDLENRLNQAEDVQPGAEQPAYADVDAQPVPADMPESRSTPEVPPQADVDAQPIPAELPESRSAPEPPPGHIPPRANGETEGPRSEQGPEKTEVKQYYPSSERRG